MVTGEEPAGEDGSTGVLTGGAGELAGKVPLGTVPAGAVSVSVTGHTVVETGMVDVMTENELAGQSVTVGAQLVIVYSLVE